MTALAGATIGVVGALAAFPRRVLAREVERQQGRLQRGITRRTTHVVFGRTLLARGDAAAEAHVEAARGNGRRPLSEGGFLRLLGLTPAPGAAELARSAFVEQSRLTPRVLDLLASFDAFEHDSEPFSFRDLILARKYAALIDGGASWGAIARSVHRWGAAGALTAQSLRCAGRGIYAEGPQGLSELDGQLLLGLEDPEDGQLEDLFMRAEAAEGEGRHDEAAALYGRCLGIDPTDAVAAFNRANCLRAAGRIVEAAHDYARAIKHDRGFVEAWFNLASLVAERGRSAAARRHLRTAIACDPDYADAVYNLASLEFDAGNLLEAGRWWERYLELDNNSEWARTAARGVQFVALQTARGMR